MRATIIRRNRMAATAMHPEEQRQSLTPDGGTGSGVVLLDDLGALRFDGADAAGFLQGYLTTDTAELGGDPQFTAMCNIKGRVVCSGFAWLEEGAVTLVLHTSLRPTVLEFLRPYLAFSKTAASAVPSRVVGVLHAAPPSRELGSLPGGHLGDGRHLFVVDDQAPESILDGISKLERSRWDEALIERREVWLEAATSGRFLPQMLGLDERGAVNFSKGCYLGQEVVARAQHRGRVKRRLTALNWSGVAPAPGCAIEANGREVGIVVAAAGTGAAGQALAVLVRDPSGPFSSPQYDTRFRLPG